jgi:tubulin beta
LFITCCDEHGIGGSGEYRDVNDAHLGRTSALCHEASSSKYVPREVLFDLDPGMIGAVALRSLPLGELLSPNSLVNHMRRQKLDQMPLQRAENQFF